METHDLFTSLLEGGVSYRYHPDRFAELSGGGHPFPSPTRTVETPSGQMIEELIQPVLQPVVLTADETSALSALAASWPRFMAAELEIFQLAKSGDLPPDACRLVESMCTRGEWEHGLIDPGYPTVHPFIRLDAVRTADGFKVVDINSTRPAGVGDLVGYLGVLNGQPPPGRVLPTRELFVRIVRSCVDEWAGSQRLPGESIPVDIVVRSTDGDWRNFHNLARVLARAGLSARAVEPDSLTAGEPSALIRSRIKEGDPAYAALAQGYPTARCVLSPLYRRFLGNKVWMYLFRHPLFASVFREHLGEAYGLFDRHFADIGIVEGGMLVLPGMSYRLDELNHDDWVLKDPASSSGRRMYLGAMMGRQKWAELLPDIRSGWIAQRYHRTIERLTVAGPTGEPVERKLFTKFGIFIFGAALAGAEFNARPSAVVHGARNTYSNPVFVA